MSSKRRQLHGGWLSLALTGIILIGGCGYPRVSADAVELTKVIDTVCNLRNDGQIDAARQLVLDRSAEGKISAAERGILEEILDMAEKGNWDSAAARCRSLLEAQNTPSPL